MLFFINFAFAFQDGKVEVTVGMTAKAQTYGGEFGDNNGWSPMDPNDPDYCSSCDGQNVVLDNGDGLVVIIADLDGDNVYETLYITNSDNGYSETITLETDQNDPNVITNADDLINYLEGDEGEQLVNDYNYDYFNDLIIEQENSYTNNDPPVSSDLTDTEKSALTAQLASDLNTKIQNKHGSNSPQMPSVVYDPNYPLSGFALYKNGIIYISPKYFNELSTDGDKLSTLFHEYTHHIQHLNNLFPLEFNDKGNVKTIGKVTLPFSQLELDERFTIDQKINNKIAPDMRMREEFMKSLIKIELGESFSYACSNYWESEVKAREAEIQGEKDGLFILSDSYRERTFQMIDEYKFSESRAIRYEIINGYNSNGIKK